MKAETTVNHVPDLPEHEDALHFSEDKGINLSEIAAALARQWRKVVVVPLAVGLCTLGATYLVPPTFTARTVFLPPQQQQSAATSAMAALGPLSGLIGGGALRTPGDQYVALMQSSNVQDRIIDRFKLIEVYDTRFRADARVALTNNVHIALGKKDGLITVEVDDRAPKRAADIANAYVEELHRITGELSLTEAQQRRVFFEAQMRSAKDRLTQAQIALQGSGFSQGALRAEPKAAAEEYARLKATVTAAEVKLQTLRGVLVGNTPEILQQQAALSALRTELARVEQKGADVPGNGDSGYISKYREFKYQETLFDLFARQYEVARLDESREGALIQVVDAATPPERKSRPKRAVLALSSTLLAGLAMCAWIALRLRGSKDLRQHHA